MSEVTHVTACRLCAGALELVVSFTPTPPGDQYLTEETHQPCYPLDLMLCTDCGAVQLADTVDPALIYPEYLYTTSVSKGLDAHFERYADDVIERLEPPLHALAVDIGSNDGTLLRALQARGCRIAGVEPASSIAGRANHAGIPTYCAFFGEAQARRVRLVDGPAEIITANHVLANVADLDDFIQGVKYLLSPTGTFVFETGYWPDIVSRNLIDTIEHEHIHYFAVTPLQRFFAKHGLTFTHVELNEAKGGSLRGFAQHAHVATSDGSVDTLIGDESAGAYTIPDRLADWVVGLAKVEQSLRTEVAKASDEIWVGYGAAVGSTLQLHQFGLGEHLICLVDDNPTKQGRLSPGHHLRVEDPSVLKRINPDRVVILAWRYAERILQQHPEWAGKWLIPLPQMVRA